MPGVECGEMTRCRPPLRSFLHLALAALVALSVVAAGTLRGQAASGGMVICTGNGPVTVQIDVSGQPVEAPAGLAHHCPDCVLAKFADVAPATPLLTRVLIARPVDARPEFRLRPFSLSVETRARAPPRVAPDL